MQGFSFGLSPHSVETVSQAKCCTTLAEDLTGHVGLAVQARSMPSMCLAHVTCVLNGRL